MLYISVFCKHIETCLNIGYNLVLSAKMLVNPYDSKGYRDFLF